MRRAEQAARFTGCRSVPRLGAGRSLRVRGLPCLAADCLSDRAEVLEPHLGVVPGHRDSVRAGPGGGPHSVHDVRRLHGTVETRLPDIEADARVDRDFWARLAPDDARLTPEAARLSADTGSRAVEVGGSRL